MISGLSGHSGTWDLLAALAGFGAGALNNLSGGGALVSYIVLVAGFRFPPMLAVVTNTAGLTAGSISGAVGHRRELRGQGRNGQPPLRISEGIFLALVACLGGYAGATLLIMLPPGALSKAVPWLLGAACLLTFGSLHRQRIGRLLGRLRRPGTPHRPQAAADRARHARRQLWAWPGVLAGGVYGGFFSAGQGTVFMAALGLVRSWGLDRIVAVRQVLTSATSSAAVMIYAIMYHPDWRVAALMTAGSLPGGWAGARISQWMPAPVLQIIVLAAGAFGVYHAVS